MGNCQSCNRSAKTAKAKSGLIASERKIDLNNFGRCGWCMLFSGGFGAAFFYLYFVMFKFIPGHSKIEYALLGISSCFFLLLLVHVAFFLGRKLSNKKIP